MNGSSRAKGLVYRPLPGLSFVQSCLIYDPETGFLTWKDRPREHFTTQRTHSTWNAKYAGKRCGYIDKDGYVTATINEVKYPAHRLIWLMISGCEPLHEIDHINGIRTDNRLCNLRQATRQENNLNTGLRRNNRSGVKGVSWRRDQKAWIASIKSGNVQVRLGRFKSIEEAAEAYRIAAKKYHGEFARPAAVIGEGRE